MSPVPTPPPKRSRQTLSMSPTPPPKQSRQTLSMSPLPPPKQSRDSSCDPSKGNSGYESGSTSPPRLLHTPIGEPFLSDSDYTVHELFSEESEKGSTSTIDYDTGSMVNTALLSHIKILEKNQHKIANEKSYFEIEDIAGNGSLVKFYTGFISYELLLTFFDFLGPSVKSLGKFYLQECPNKKEKVKSIEPVVHYSCEAASQPSSQRSCIQVWYIYWTCLKVYHYFLYQHLKEIDWAPTTQQVAGTLPVAFKHMYNRTYAMIDDSEVFIQVPSDLQMQSFTWSSYKHNNTAKFLIACTPNGAISYVSPLYVGSISDVQLTKVSGFLEKIEGKNGISIMADRGFTIQKELSPFNVSLNIPPFMEGRDQLPADEVQKGRQIASLRIHIECVIGHIKNFSILTGTLPLSMARLNCKPDCKHLCLAYQFPALSCTIARC